MCNTYKVGLLLSLLAVLISCNSKEDDYTAYFGGEITNPTSPYVIFYKDNKVIDTIALDKQNRFFVKFDSLTPGLYSFKHNPDYQYVYFDKNDSLMVSINGNNFDRSIAFSGRGDRKNNFLTELYLQHEEDRIKSYEFYDYDFPRFKRAIDSTFVLRKKFYAENKRKIKWSNGFDYYAATRLNLNYCTKKEYYPYLHARRTGKVVQQALPKDYYDHRDTIKFNDPRLINFSPFVRYLTAMLNNIAITRHFTDINVAENPLQDNIAKLKIADTTFKDEAIKNEVLNSIAFNYLLEDQNVINNRQFLEEFMKFSTDENPENEILKLGRAIQKLEKGNKLPEAELLTVNNKDFDIEGGTGKETVIYFWTACAKTQMEIACDKVSQLRKQHPDVNFIAVNVDQEREWKKAVKPFGFKHALQLRAKSFNDLKYKWAITKISRTIVLNPDGTIKNAFTDLMDSDFKNYLK